MIWSLVGVLLAATGLGGVAIWQNTYDIREERVTLRQGKQTLDGVLATPTDGRGPYGLVVFVHGDGPIDATHDSFYRPLWESFAEAGYASLSWNKPGVDGSSGNWLDQSMDDRADETMAAIAWARQRPDIDSRRIGLWGASQAGWVLPKVAARAPDLRFVIAVSPAVNWQQQGRYNLLAQMREDGASAEQTAAALRRRKTTLRLLRRDASFEEYRDTVDDPQGMTADRWRFIKKNYTADATADLRAIQGTPVLLVLAGHDINVDVTDTETTYRKLLPASLLRVEQYPDATHSLVKHNLEQSELKLTLTAVFAPRALFASGFLTGQRQFLKQANADASKGGRT
ncbi:CocE/NonD family hydrolase [Streptomyces sp. ISL-98]|uniref:alpha/beta hydrolase family protein n=1 Tax=Streptomyces sp. ISL-98 TaxID=2819192 RepID=UPI0027E53FF0|nr:CocE/NonD family hydrolase [Streptomyces sp. ISL-98]